MSPYDGLDNAVLTIELLTGELGTDEVGNAIALTTLVPVKSFLKVASLSANSLEKKAQYPGVDDTAIKVEGYCIEPMVLPSATLADNWYRCAFEGIAGWIYLIFPLNPPYGRVGMGEILEQAQGTAISGWFQVSRSN